MAIRIKSRGKNSAVGYAQYVYDPTSSNSLVLINHAFLVNQAEVVRLA